MDLIVKETQSVGISSVTEKTYKRGFRRIVINENDRLHLKSVIQKNFNHLFRRRHDFPSTISSDAEIEDESSHRERLVSSLGSVRNDGIIEEDSLRRERLSSPLVSVSSCNVSGYIDFYGSPFIYKWILIFTKGRMKITFDILFPALREGLIAEGKIDPRNNVAEIEAILLKVEKKTHKMSSNEKIKELQNCSAKLYTKGCYIYRAVNAALCADDPTKRDTLGPFCFLLFNYIGRRFEDSSSMFDRLRQIRHSKEVESMTLYRGDRNSGNTIEEYRRAAGDNSKQFKWLSFVSTSSDRNVAERFAFDVLYIIEVPSYSSNEDQITDLSTLSHFVDENEMLFLPGIEFHVDKVERDEEKELDLVYIKINTSYISRLK